MDVRLADKTVQMKELIERAIMQIATSIPARVDSFDPLTMTVNATPAIQMKTYIDYESEDVTLPQIINIPVVTYGAGDFFITNPIQRGDNCLLFFSQRAIDNWFDKGGIQPSGDGIGSRHHDITDAFALFSPFPLPNVLQSYSTNAMELRNQAGTIKISISSTAINITNGSLILSVGNDGTVGITGGNLEVSGNISDSVNTMASMRSTYNAHTHVAPPGGGTTSVPSGLMI